MTATHVGPEAAAAADGGWDALVGAALLGTERREFTADRLPAGVAELVRALPAGAPPAAGLLGVAALMTAYRRAGARPGRAAAPPPEPAPDDPAPAVGVAASTRLAGLLADGDAELAAEWLRAAAAAGRRARPESLPALLDAAAKRPALAPLAVAVLGRRGEWLAAHRPEWTRLVSVHAAALPRRELDGSAWSHGDRSARRAYFAELRHREPDRAGTLLRQAWARESGEDRAALLRMLADGLGDADEPLLEMALDDRLRSVREVAATHLSRLPRSAFAARMRDRLAACVRHERGRAGRGGRLVVTPPERCDDAMVRDGVRAVAEIRGVGARAWWLRQVVAATPLPLWRELFGAGPDALLSCDADDDWAGVLLAGWTDAAVRQRDAEWALALVPGAGLSRGPLLDVLPDAERGLAVAALVEAGEAREAGHERHTVSPAVLAACPAPWPAPLAEAILAHIGSLPGEPHAYGTRDLLRLAALRLPPGAAPAVHRLVRRRPPDSPWRDALTDLADTLALRHQMLEEIR